jgi:hypothetical protein
VGVLRDGKQLTRHFLCASVLAEGDDLSDFVGADLRVGECETCRQERDEEKRG